MIDATRKSERSTYNDNRLLVGKFGAAQGLKGEVRLQSYTADPFAIGSYGPLTSEDGRIFEITHLRAAKTVLVARIKGVTDRNSAEKLTHLALYMDRSLLGDTQEEDEFFHADLVGLKVETADGTLLGHVLALYNFGAGDMLEIRPETPGKTVMLPFTKAAVPEVNIKSGRLIADMAAFETALDDKPDPLTRFE